MTVDHAADARRLRVDQPWRDRAACIGLADVMDPPADQVTAARDAGAEWLLTEAAKQVCRACPVLVQCRSWVVTLPARADVTGVCGGLTEEERARERRAQPGAAPEPPPLPGDRLRCTRCGQVKPDGEFAADPRLIGRRGRRSHCRTCVAAWRREHRAARRQP